jgi:hypothetical protein
MVQENMYAQRFCGLSPAQVADYMHPASGLSNFRAKIGPHGMALIEDGGNRLPEQKLNRPNAFGIFTQTVQRGWEEQ